MRVRPVQIVGDVAIVPLTQGYCAVIDAAASAYAAASAIHHGVFGKTHDRRSA